MNARVERLCDGFSHYLAFFEKSDRFSGPSLYFHHRTIDRLREHQVFTDVSEDGLFFEYLYATLTAWGPHRMGPGGAKLVDFNTLVESICSQKGEIGGLHDLHLSSLPDERTPEVTDRLSAILDKLSVSATETKLVANSKALHHLLPDLIPPIDRTYTLRFFFNNTTIDGRDEQLFRTMYPLFANIAHRTKREIEGAIGRKFHTSETKVIDNAIVGFVLEELRS